MASIPIGMRKALIMAQFGLMLVAYHLCQVILTPLRAARRGAILYHRIEDQLAGVLASVIAWWCTDVMGLAVCMTYTGTYNAEAGGDRLIVLSNHVCYADWLAAIILCDAIRRPHAGRVRWVAKSDAMKIPLIGWVMRNRDCIGLARKFAEDAGRIVTAIAKYVDEQIKFWLIMYPEGRFVDASDATVVMDNTKLFCQEHAVDVPTHVLMPRHKGLSTIIAEFKRAGVERVPVADVTMAYRGQAEGASDAFNTALPLRDAKRRLPSPIDLLAGTGPREVHFNIEHMEMRDGDDVKTLLYKTWKQKDARLQAFERDGCFNAPLKVVPEPHDRQAPAIFLLFAVINAMYVKWQLTALINFLAIPMTVVAAVPIGILWYHWRLRMTRARLTAT